MGCLTARPEMATLDDEGTVGNQTEPSTVGSRGDERETGPPAPVQHDGLPAVTGGAYIAG